MKTIHPAVAEHVIEENCRLREALRRIADLPIDPCSTENDYRLSGAKAIAEGALSQQAEPDHDCNYRTGGVICKVCDLNVIKQAEDTDTFTAVDMATAAAQEFRDGQAAVEPASAQDEREAFVAWATRLYSTGYHAGHHHTVEGEYTHVYRQDMDSYHEEVVEEWLTDNPQPASLTRPAQTAPKTAAKMPCGTAVTNVYEAYEAGKRAAAPQQNGLVEAAKAFADAARKNIYPCPDKPDSLSGKLQSLDRAIAAALSAQGPKP